MELRAKLEELAQQLALGEALKEAQGHALHEVRNFLTAVEITLAQRIAAIDTPAERQELRPLLDNARHLQRVFRTQLSDMLLEPMRVLVSVGDLTEKLGMLFTLWRDAFHDRLALAVLCDSWGRWRLPWPLFESCINNLLLNAFNYAPYGLLELQLKKQPGGLRIQLVDEGPGLTAKVAEPVSLGAGLQFLQQRVAAAGGELQRTAMGVAVILPGELEQAWSPTAANLSVHVVAAFPAYGAHLAQQLQAVGIAAQHFPNPQAQELAAWTHAPPSHSLRATASGVQLEVLESGVQLELPHPVLLPQLVKAFWLGADENLAHNPSSVTVLVVDDDPFSRLAARQTLSGGEYEVLEAATWEEASRILHTNNVQVVLLDLHLAEFSPEDLLEAVAATESSVPVFALTGGGNYALLQLAETHPRISRVLPKPLSLYKLQQAMKETPKQHWKEPAAVYSAQAHPAAESTAPGLLSAVPVPELARRFAQQALPRAHWLAQHAAHPGGDFLPELRLLQRMAFAVGAKRLGLQTQLLSEGFLDAKPYRSETWQNWLALVRETAAALRESHPKEAAERL